MTTPERRADAAALADACYFPDQSDSQAALWREALELWLHWHDEHDRITAAIYHARRHPQQLAKLADKLDQIDHLRWRAVELSQTLLES